MILRSVKLQKRQPAFLALLLLPFLFVSLTANPLRAEGLKIHPTPFTALLDFKTLADPSVPRPPFPIWLAKVERAIAPEDAAQRTLWRIYFRPMPGINDTMMLRLFFDDAPSARPILTAWDESGTCIFGPETFGSGSDVASSETAVIPMARVAYIDISVPGDGTNLHNALLCSLTTISVLRPLDFSSSKTQPDPFRSLMESGAESDGDSYLLGRVNAALEIAPIELSNAKGNSSLFDFSLEKPPLMAILTFEIKNVNLDMPPEVAANGHLLSPVNLQLPDLADPAYQAAPIGIASFAEDLHYGGWIRCQQIIPGDFLQAGANKIRLLNGDTGETVIVRNLHLQLKYAPQQNH